MLKLVEVVDTDNKFSLAASRRRLRMAVSRTVATGFGSPVNVASRASRARLAARDQRGGPGDAPEADVDFSCPSPGPRRSGELGDASFSVREGPLGNRSRGAAKHDDLAGSSP